MNKAKKMENIKNNNIPKPKKDIITKLYATLIENCCVYSISDINITYGTNLQKAKEEFGDLFIEAYMEMNYEEYMYDDSKTYFVGMYIKRYETDDEFAERTGKEFSRQKEQQDREYQQYLKLKTKFENNES